MATYVYKVNKRSRVGYHFGDWHECFRAEQPTTWGLREIVCEHEDPQPGDRIIAYQGSCPFCAQHGMACNRANGHGSGVLLGDGGSRRGAERGQPSAFSNSLLFLFRL
jgi:hypothetical protein